MLLTSLQRLLETKNHGKGLGKRIGCAEKYDWESILMKVTASACDLLRRSIRSKRQMRGGDMMGDGAGMQFAKVKEKVHNAGAMILSVSNGAKRGIIPT